ncbi:MAG: Stp1/IreP family PP2C-type Ser/Thr phosphatase [Oscillospiraceae bacterium]|nr:Stp1/IreP family PP2C-type Ser/Thr phosphatase [Oscillospiraceae bacterium]
MRIWGMTHRGAVRGENQDSYYFTSPDENGLTLGVVCDGMGGAKGGKVASRLAIRTFTDQLRSNFHDNLEEGPLKQALENAAQISNQVIYERSIAEPGLQGMGTTMVAAAVQPGSAVVLNVGDSRAYHIKNGAIERITNDHSLVEDMVSRGKITQEEARHHPQKNLITRALGAEKEVVCDLFSIPLSIGDYLVLCSDGLSNLVPEKELLAKVLHSGEPSTCCESLLNLVLSRGAPDNVTIVLFQF